jgi:hypothetical protein
MNLEIFNALGTITQSSKISRGTLREKIIFDFIVKKFNNNKIVRQKKIPLPKGFNKTNSRRIDILMIDSIFKKISIFECKSDGTNNNRPVLKEIELYNEIENYFKTQYPDYEIETVFIKTNGEMPIEFNNTKFKVIKTNDFINDDIEKIENASYIQIINTKIDSQIKKLSNENKQKFLNIIKILNN